MVRFIATVNAKKIPGVVESAPPPVKLTVRRAKAAAMINEQVDLGEELITLNPRSLSGQEELKEGFRKWHEYNLEMLGLYFDNNSVLEKYRADSRGHPVSGGGKELALATCERIERGIRFLEDLKYRLRLIPEVDPASVTSRGEAVPRPAGRNVFIVHGHDEAALQAVARFIEKLNLDPIILQEKASGGRTLIEKLERYTDVAYGVVLLTPDDEGRRRPKFRETAPELQARARQNVILELGYLIGRLGRERVCALYKGPLELPSDYERVVYIEMDAAEGWHRKLFAELRDGGMDVKAESLV